MLHQREEKPVLQQPGQAGVAQAAHHQRHGDLEHIAAGQAHAVRGIPARDQRIKCLRDAVGEQAHGHEQQARGSNGGNCVDVEQCGHDVGVSLAEGPVYARTKGGPAADGGYLPQWGGLGVAAPGLEFPQIVCQQQGAQCARQPDAAYCQQQGMGQESGGERAAKQHAGVDGVALEGGTALVQREQQAAGELTPKHGTATANAQQEQQRNGQLDQADESAGQAKRAEQRNDARDHAPSGLDQTAQQFREVAVLLHRDGCHQPGLKKCPLQNGQQQYAGAYQDVIAVGFGAQAAQQYESNNETGSREQCLRDNRISNQFGG